MVPIPIVNGVYKPSYNWGAPPCRYNELVTNSYCNGVYEPTNITGGHHAVLTGLVIFTFFTLWRMNLCNVNQHESVNQAVKPYTTINIGGMGHGSHDVTCPYLKRCFPNGTEQSADKIWKPTQ